jgi:hypothetical protein
MLVSARHRFRRGWLVVDLTSMSQRRFLPEYQLDDAAQNLVNHADEHRQQKRRDDHNPRRFFELVFRWPSDLLELVLGIN